MPADNYKPPGSRLEQVSIVYLAALVGGILATIIIVLPLEVLFDVPPALVGIIEEPAKLIGLLLIALFLPDWLRSKKTCAVAGALAGLGFAFAENLWYYLGFIAIHQFNPVLIYGRTALSLPFHVLVSAIAGMGVLYIAAKGRRGVTTFLGLLVVAIVLHGLWNSGQIVVWFLLMLVIDLAAFAVIYATLPKYPIPDSEIAVLQLPKREIWVTRDRTFGRRDFRDDVPIANLPQISKAQFRISKRKTQFFIEDCSRAGGVLLDGVEIRGAGQRRLGEGSLISLPSGLQLRFVTLGTMERVMVMPTTLGSIATDVQQVGMPTYPKLVIPENGTIELQKAKTELGRADFTDAVPSDRLQRISRRHFAITLSEGTYYIEDLGSMNGTIVNGRAIRGIGRIALLIGDEIEIPGAVKMRYVLK
jgi:pSer/pThr/pTyr-binding forkhead associated (FHA) protein